MAADHSHQSPGGGDSAMLRFFLPGIVVGIVIGSMLGLYVGTRSGSSPIPEITPSGAAHTQAPVHEDERASASPDQPAETAPASTGTPAQPKDEPKPAETPKP